MVARLHPHEPMAIHFSFSNFCPWPLIATHSNSLSNPTVATLTPHPSPITPPHSPHLTHHPLPVTSWLLPHSSLFAPRSSFTGPFHHVHDTSTHYISLYKLVRPSVSNVSAFGFMGCILYAPLLIMAWHARPFISGRKPSPWGKSRSLEKRQSELR